MLLSKFSVELQDEDDFTILLVTRRRKESVSSYSSDQLDNVTVHSDNSLKRIVMRGDTP